MQEAWRRQAIFFERALRRPESCRSSKTCERTQEQHEVRRVTGGWQFARAEARLVHRALEVGFLLRGREHFRRGNQPIEKE